MVRRFVRAQAPIHVDFTMYRVLCRTGHDGFTPVTRFLYKLLTARGHTVWFDEESLNVGASLSLLPAPTACMLSYDRAPVGRMLV